MRFGPLQRQYFQTTDGAYSTVTDREVYDSQITLTGEEVDVACGFFGAANIHRGNVASGGSKAKKQFYIFQSNTGLLNPMPVELNLVFPKPEKNELRLYLKGAIFKPEPGRIWFIFKKDDKIVLGDMNENAWRTLGRDDPDDETYIDEIYTGRKAPAYRTFAAGQILVRNPALAAKSFTLAGFECEVDKSHRLFTSRATGSRFLEAHHLIPLKYQTDFTTSLDFQENITALCPYCHRAIHHSTVDETRALLDVLYHKRAHVQDVSKISMTGLYRLYSCEKIT